MPAHSECKKDVAELMAACLAYFLHLLSPLKPEKGAR